VFVIRRVIGKYYKIRNQGTLKTKNLVHGEISIFLVFVFFDLHFLLYSY
jgi:hypothetical protein